MCHWGCRGRPKRVQEAPIERRDHVPQVFALPSRLGVRENENRPCPLAMRGGDVFFADGQEVLFAIEAPSGYTQRSASGKNDHRDGQGCNGWEMRRGERKNSGK